MVEFCSKIFKKRPIVISCFHSKKWHKNQQNYKEIKILNIWFT